MPSRGLLIYRITEAAYRRPEWVNRVELAQHLGVNPSSLSPWMWRLLWYRAATEDQTLRFDPNRVLQFASHYRLSTLEPHPPITTTLDEQAVHHALAEIPHVFCMFTAANTWAFFEPYAEHHVYVPPASLPAARAALPASNRRARTTGQLHLYAARVEDVPRTTRGGLPVTTLFQTMLDLRAHPTGGAHAEFLRQLISNQQAGDARAPQ